MFTFYSLILNSYETATKNNLVAATIMGVDINEEKKVGKMAGDNFLKLYLDQKSRSSERLFNKRLKYNYTLVTLAACAPLGPCSISNSTCWPSAKVLKPSP